MALDCGELCTDFALCIILLFASVFFLLTKIVFFLQWDRIDIYNVKMTVQDLIDHLKTQYNVDLAMLSTGVTILYSDFMPRPKLKVCVYALMFSSNDYHLFAMGVK